MSLALNELQAVLYPSLAAGCLVGGVLVWIAAGRNKPLVILPLVFLAILAVWFSLAAGTHYGYGAWQSIDDPPDEAFADGAKLVGSVFFGWIPSVGFCVMVFLVSRLLRRRPRAAPDGVPELS